LDNCCQGQSCSTPKSKKKVVCPWKNTTYSSCAPTTRPAQYLVRR
jgi:hypothetical protein